MSLLLSLLFGVFCMCVLFIIGIYFVEFILNVIGAIIKGVFNLILFIWNLAVTLMDWVLSSWVAFGLGVIGIILILL